VSGSETGPGQPVRLARRGRGAPKAPYPSYWVWVLVPGGGGCRSPGSGGGGCSVSEPPGSGGAVDGPATLGGLAGWLARVLRFGAPRPAPGEGPAV